MIWLLVAVGGLLAGACWPFEVDAKLWSRPRRRGAGLWIRVAWGGGWILVWGHRWRWLGRPPRRPVRAGRQWGPRAKGGWYPWAVAGWVLLRRMRGRRLRVVVQVGTGDGATTAAVVGGAQAIRGALAAAGLAVRLSLRVEWQRRCLWGAVDFRGRLCLWDVAVAALFAGKNALAGRRRAGRARRAGTASALP